MNELNKWTKYGICCKRKTEDRDKVTCEQEVQNLPCSKYDDPLTLFQFTH